MSTKIQDDVAVIDKVKIKEPVNYNVIIHDNPLTSFEEVIFVVSRCFEKTEQEAEKIAHIVNNDKRGICGTYTKEIAENKLVIVELAKQHLMVNFPTRAKAIQVLKFTLEKA